MTTKRMEHGTNSMYTGPERCRCRRCRSAHNTYARDYRNRNKLRQLVLTIEILDDQERVVKRWTKRLDPGRNYRVRSTQTIVGELPVGGS